MRGEVLGHEFPGCFDVIKALDANPQRFSPRLAVALAAEMTAEACHHACGVSQRRRLFRRGRLLVDETIQRLPLGEVSSKKTVHGTSGVSRPS